MRVDSGVLGLCQGRLSFLGWGDTGRWMALPYPRRHFVSAMGHPVFGGPGIWKEPRADGFAMAHPSFARVGHPGLFGYLAFTYLSYQLNQLV